MENKELIMTLENEENELIKKIEKCRRESDYNNYKNLIRILTEVTKLKHDEERIAKENGNLDEWTLRYSDYKTEGDNSDDERLIRIVAVWEQKGDKIRNHRMFEVNREVEYNDTYGSKGEISSNPIMAEIDKIKFRTVYKLL